ncbi:MAG: glycosyltransferase family 4 protein [Patescibacteria group bacterium]
MKICLIAPIDESIPPLKYGGIERIVHLLTDNLIKHNHKVTLLAPSDSKSPAIIIPTISQSIKGFYCNSKTREAYLYIALSKILKIISQQKFDLIHNHFGWRLIPFIKSFKSPTITTFHTTLDQIDEKTILNIWKDTPLITISKSQRKCMPDLNYIANIYNGIDTSLYHFSKQHQGYLAFLGRISPEKGVSEAIQISKTLKKKLIIAGPIPLRDKQYFQEKVYPYIDDKNCIYLGEINDQQKDKLLGKAEALLAPIQWAEPFGLILIEAMACGTPIIALNRGAIPEIIIDKITGITGESIKELIQRFKEIKNIKRENCRKLVEEKFTALIMVQKYEKIYKKFLSNLNSLKTNRF